MYETKTKRLAHLSLLSITGYLSSAVNQQENKYRKLQQHVMDMITLKGIVSGAPDLEVVC